MVLRSAFISPTSQPLDGREGFGNLHVLVAERDYRMASLVQRLLFSFGFRLVDMVVDAEEVLRRLRDRAYDMVITEWNMTPIHGLELLKTIRNAQEDAGFRRDIPVIMLTAHTDVPSVEAARDAGVTEFVAKPFSARTLSRHIIQIIDTPRVFVQSPGYSGPCRRRKEGPPPGTDERRGTGVASATLTPPDTSLKERLGPFSAADILSERTVNEAQTQLLKQEDDFIDWAREDIERLEAAYGELVVSTQNTEALQTLKDVSYSIQSSAQIFGYKLGTEVAGMLVEYLSVQTHLRPDNLIVVRKHIDTIHVIFTQKFKDEGHAISEEMVFVLRRLTAIKG